MKFWEDIFKQIDLRDQLLHMPIEVEVDDLLNGVRITRVTTISDLLLIGTDDQAHMYPEVPKGLLPAAKDDGPMAE